MSAFAWATVKVLRIMAKGMHPFQYIRQGPDDAETTGLTPKSDSIPVVIAGT